MQGAGSVEGGTLKDCISWGYAGHGLGSIVSSHAKESISERVHIVGVWRALAHRVSIQKSWILEVSCWCSWWIVCQERNQQESTIDMMWGFKCCDLRLGDRGTCEWASEVAMTWFWALPVVEIKGGPMISVLGCFLVLISWRWYKYCGRRPARQTSTSGTWLSDKDHGGSLVMRRTSLVTIWTWSMELHSRWRFCAWRCVFDSHTCWRSFDKLHIWPSSGVFPVKSSRGRRTSWDGNPLREEDLLVLDSRDSQQDKAWLWLRVVHIFEDTKEDSKEDIQSRDLGVLDMLKWV